MNAILFVILIFTPYFLILGLKRYFIKRRIKKAKASLERINAIMAPIYPMTREELDAAITDSERRMQEELQTAERSAQRAYRLRYLHYLMQPVQYVGFKLRLQCLHLKLQLVDVLFEKGLLRGKRPVLYKVVEGRIVEKRSVRTGNPESGDDTHALHLPHDGHGD